LANTEADLSPRLQQTCETAQWQYPRDNLLVRPLVRPPDRSHDRRHVSRPSRPAITNSKHLTPCRHRRNQHHGASFASFPARGRKGHRHRPPSRAWTRRACFCPLMTMRTSENGVRETTRRKKIHWAGTRMPILQATLAHFSMTIPNVCI